MPKAHIPRKMLEDFLSCQLSKEETKKVVRHLLSGCAACRKAAKSIRQAQRKAEVPRASEGTYTRLLDRLKLSASLAKGEAESLLYSGELDWEELRPLSHNQRLLVLRNNPRLCHWGLFRTVLEEARRPSSMEPLEAVDLAQLAVVVAEELDPVPYGAESVQDSRANAHLVLANAKRIAGDFQGAEAAFRLAGQCLAQGTGDPLEEANYLLHYGAFRGALGEFEEAVEVIRPAVRIYEKFRQQHDQGKALILQASIIGHADPALGANLAERGLSIIDRDHEPRLELSGLHALAHARADLGDVEEARSILTTYRYLYRQCASFHVTTRMHWLEGIIAREAGDLPEAAAVFGRLRRTFLARDYQYEASLVALDLSQVLCAQRRYYEAEHLLADILPVLERLGLGPHTLAAWSLLVKSVQERSVASEMFRAVSQLVRRTWIVPEGAARMREAGDGKVS
jgi:tetratricopeptide (TPR) repeat protein